jgi:hypothetical protein
VHTNIKLETTCLSCVKDGKRNRGVVERNSKSYGDTVAVLTPNVSGFCRRKMYTGIDGFLFVTDVGGLVERRRRRRAQRTRSRDLGK